MSESRSTTARNAAPGSRTNNFDALRLVGAMSVLIGHGYVLHGRAADVPATFGLGIHPMGLALFFSISGYLIMGSWLSRPVVSHYLTNRAARILPALAASSILTALLLGPVVTTLPAGDYFGDRSTWTYLANTVPVLPQYDLPGVFANVPYPLVVNGSLWTLRVEFACYFGVLAIGMLPRIPRIALLLVAGVIAAAVSQLNVMAGDANVSASTGVATYFIAGALLRHCPRRVLDARVALLLLVPWALITAFTSREAAEILSFAVLPYVVISIGLAATPGVRRAARFGDFSYGIYLWAFPVQQTILLVAPGLPLALSIAACAVISTALAIASWHFVENPVLTGKGRLPWMRRQFGTVQV